MSLAEGRPTAVILGGCWGMLPQEVIVILDVLRHILVDSEAYRKALGTELFKRLIGQLIVIIH